MQAVIKWFIALDVHCILSVSQQRAELKLAGFAVNPVVEWQMWLLNLFRKRPKLSKLKMFFKPRKEDLKSLSRGRKILKNNHFYSQY